MTAWLPGPSDSSGSASRSSVIPTGVEAHALSRGRIAIVYDWDSLDLSTETRLVGAAAATFTANFELDVPYAPSPDKARRFMDEYSAARQRPFSRAQREEVAAVTLYLIAYSARCAHALGERGDVIEALQRFGVEYLKP